MSVLGALGGIGRGLTAGIQDMERADEAKSRKELAQFAKLQQQRQQQEWAQSDAADAALAKVPTTYTAKLGLPTRDDDGNTMPSAPRKRQEVLRDQALAVSGAGGMKNAIQASAFETQARGLDREAFEDQDRKRRISAEDLAATTAAAERKRQEYLQKTLKAWELAQNPASSRAALEMVVSNYNADVNDDRQAVYDPKANTIGFATHGKFTHQPIVATPEVVKELVGNALRFANPEMLKLFMANDVANKKADAEATGVKNQGLYQNGMTRYYEGKNDIDRAELKAKKDAGYFAPRGGAGGAGAGAIKLKEVAEDGTHVAYGRDGPLYNVLPDGMRAPLGVTGQVLQRERDKAAAVGVKVMIGDKGGKPILAYMGKDNNPYYTLEEARAAPAPKTK